jgi:hypothetical protein
MKKTIIFPWIASLLLSFGASAQQNTEEKLNLPGDNLNLYAVMDLFQKSPTLEGFEKSLNEEDSKINNLDLNGDDKTDYISVSDDVDGDTHTIVLSVSISEKEKQDVAVFTVEKVDKDKVQIQLIGDEELYGKNYIIEPGESSTPNPGYTGNTKASPAPAAVSTTTTTAYVSVSAWPVVSFIFLPTYVVYHSPWYWGYYPPYYRPWTPYYYHYYYGYHSHYHNHYYSRYRPCTYYRSPVYTNRYYNHRASAPSVSHRRQTGVYDRTYSRPEMVRNGSADFNKRHPDARGGQYRQPSKNNQARPDSRPAVNPSAKPSKPGNQGRPSTKPAVPSGNQRPASKPASNDKMSKPAGKPDGGSYNRPSGGNNNSRPAVSPSARPEQKSAKPRPSTAPSGGKTMPKGGGKR